ncbi:T9SS type B sorting domain-containing protein [Flavobacterium sp. CYK-4]|uniref:choice-of-anchor L domain-containing protein n=1 Tax=Flavobacterium lotistagni TaxID=2709660 RepID=UPI00140D889E|nr:choice-of-anchor L domain-containing protein [Flavobacterium lotistagni]NHM06235.1 T9SS type B sorting domain-containing protein [Flavobacterium lotistagni]
MAQYIQVNDTYTAQQLVENVLINSPCANVSNFTVNGDPFSAGEQSFGFFNATGTTFPFSQGVVLSTSRAKRTEGPNSNLIDEGSTAWGGDSDLEQALNITGTYNATVLEFDFTPLTNLMSFDYIFASEEYQGNAPCRYSDGFAFLLKKAGTADAYQNLALIPNTTIPVLVTSVHPSLPGCDAENEAYFGSFNTSNAPINLNGQTVVMTAQATVVPGMTYHIKLVIADHENIRYDSAIFLGGGTFKVGADLGPDRLALTNNAICQGENYPLDATQSGTNSYKWFKNGTQIPGEFNPTYNVTTPGIYSVEVTLGATACVATGEVEIEYLPAPTLTNTTLVQCDEDQDGTTLFNLTRLDTIITNNDSTFGPVTYYENLMDAQNQNTSNAIVNPAAYSSTAKTIYASTSNASGCFGEATIQLQISSHSSAFVKDYETCDLDSVIDGYYTFALTDLDATVLNGLPTGLLVNYYPSLNDALLQTNQLPANYTNTTQFVDRIYTRIINGSDCYSIQAVDLYINSNTPPNFEDELIYQCDNNPQTVTIANNFTSYLWSNGDTDNSTIFTSSGDYTVTVSNGDGCLATKKFTVINFNTPVIIGVQVNDFEGGNNNLFVNAIGNGNYEYSLDGVHFQSSPNFYNVRPGEYQVHVRDNNCGEDFYEIVVLDYPAYFTPNDDGYHDRWQIKNSEILSGSRMRIFNRYGKLLKETSELQKGWDGTFNGNRLPADDYWFVLDLANGKTVNGHFSLKR